MADDKGPRTAANAGEQPVRRTTGSFLVEGVSGSGQTPRDPRLAVTVPVCIRYKSILDFHDTQSVNLSRSGVFISCSDPRPVGTIVDFEFALTDGLTLFRGKGEVVRVTSTPVAGMGVRFRDLDEEARRFIDRVVLVNEQEGRRSAVPLDFVQDAAPSSNPLRGATNVQVGLSVNGREMRIRLTPLTVGYFVNNPLLNIRLGGFVVPCDENASLGALFDVAIEGLDGQALFVGKGKVVAKQEHRLGIRLSEADKAVLARLQAEIGRIGPMGPR